MSISVAISTYSGDSSDSIISCLKSVYDWIDEIIIYYGSQKDETITKLKKFDVKKKIKFIFGENYPMFHINKQRAIDATTSDWILQLDTDEVVSPELKREIIKTIESDPVENGFWIPRLNYFLGRPLTKGGQYPDPTIRLYRQGKGRLPCKSIHEQAEIDGDVGYLKADLLHFPWPTIEDYLNKALIRYGLLEAQLLYKKGIRPSLLNAIVYFKILPIIWFLKTYLRHRGYVDGYAGFVFSLFSSLRYWIAYVKLIEMTQSGHR